MNSDSDNNLALMVPNAMVIMLKATVAVVVIVVDDVFGDNDTRNDYC